MNLFYSININAFKNKLFSYLKAPFVYITIFNIVIIVSALLIEIIAFTTYKENVPIIIKIVSLLVLSFYFILCISNWYKAHKLHLLKQNYEIVQIRNKTLGLLYDNVRCFKHDFDNIIQSIGGYIFLNDMNGLKKYYSNLLDDCKQTNNLNLLNPETINNPSIYSLLTNKYFVATEKGIKMIIQVFTDLSNINFNIYELSRILGILLDNAIEAAQYTVEKLIEIEFLSDKKKQLFIIRNSCNDLNISITKIFEKGYSTKENNSGIGLWKVHKILSKSKNANLYTTIKDQKFTQQLEIYYE